MKFFATLSTLAAIAGSVAAKNITVTVGAGGNLTYTPAEVQAEVGDVVNFVFTSKNHTVTQSSFANPCKLLVNATTNVQGFDSGFVPVGNITNEADFPVYSIKVQDTKPIWAYCKQGTHCSGAGMVMAINAVTDPAGNTFEKFLANAKSSTPAAGSPSASANTPPISSSGPGVPTSTTGDAITTKVQGVVVALMGLGVGALLA